MTELTSTAERLNDLRRRYLAGEEWTRDELKSAIHTMIGNRLDAVRDAGATKTKTKAAPVSLDDLLGTVPPPEKPKQITAAVEKPLKQATAAIEKPKPTTKPDVSGFF